MDVDAVSSMARIDEAPGCSQQGGPTKVLAQDLGRPVAIILVDPFEKLAVGGASLNGSLVEVENVGSRSEGATPLGRLLFSLLFPRFLSAFFWDGHFLR